MMQTVSNLSRIGLVGTVAIILILGLAAVREPSRQDAARSERQDQAITMGTDLYALHCAECHGSLGQGNITEAATELNTEYMRAQEADWLYDTIALGRSDTEMAAFSLDRGGALNGQQIRHLVTLIRTGTWDTIAARVAELGMVSQEEIALASATRTPPPTEIPLPTAVAAVVNDPLPVIPVIPTATPAPSGPSPEEQSRAIYVQYCGSCHGSAGEGTGDGPALTSSAIRQMSRPELTRISFDNDEIEGHDVFLSPDEKRAILAWLEELAR